MPRGMERGSLQILRSSATEGTRSGPELKLTKTLEHLPVVCPMNSLDSQFSHPSKGHQTSIQISSPNSGTSCPTGLCSERGERQLCNAVPVETVFWYMVWRKVSTPESIDRCSPLSGLNRPGCQDNRLKI